jgi:CRP-like cAMP-binding protein
MEKYLDLLQSVPLFQDITIADLQALLPCLAARTAQFARGQTIFGSGTRMTHFGIVLLGQVQVVQDDFFGNRSMLGQMGPSELVGESFACAADEVLPVNAIAASECDLLLIDCGRLATPCAQACDFHSKLIKNMLSIVARKNIALTQKLELAARRTTREKLLAFLSAEAKRAGSNTFCIPFSRQELADHLYVERSAMSVELSRLKREQRIDFRKNQFRL